GLYEKICSQFIHRLLTKIGNGRRTGVADCPGLREQGEAKSSEIAVADKYFAAIRGRLPVNLGQDTAQTVAAASRHHNRMFLLDGALNGRKTIFIRAGKSLMHCQR